MCAEHAAFFEAEIVQKILAPRGAHLVRLRDCKQPPHDPPRQRPGRPCPPLTFPDRCSLLLPRNLLPPPSSW